ncbi:MAG: hypothetical protein AABW80_02125, partial [Nanoarchaeota archaeon]
FCSRFVISFSSFDNILRFPFIDYLEAEEARIVKNLPRDKWFPEIVKLEEMAERILGYSYEKGMGAGSSHFRDRWKNARELKDSQEGLYRRIALSNFIKHRFFIHHIAYFNGCLILAAKQNLYALPLTELSEKPQIIAPYGNRVWTFKDNIAGITTVSGELLKQMKAKADIRIGKRPETNTPYPTQKNWSYRQPVNA